MRFKTASRFLMLALSASVLLSLIGPPANASSFTASHSDSHRKNYGNSYTLVGFSDAWTFNTGFWTVTWTLHGDSFAEWLGSQPSVNTTSMQLTDAVTFNGAFVSISGGTDGAGGTISISGDTYTIAMPRQKNIWQQSDSYSGLKATSAVALTSYTHATTGAFLFGTHQETNICVSGAKPNGSTTSPC
jgi:hypothetical protein